MRVQCGQPGLGPRVAKPKNRTPSLPSTQFDIASITTPTPLTSFNGGAGLAGATGGVCTNCHTGENVFNIHPGTALDVSALGISDKPVGFVQPIVPASWPQNPSPNTIDGACGSCHNQSVAGRFPLLSQEVSGYCGIMVTAWMRPTMPPAGTPDSPDFREHFLRMQQACMATQAARAATGPATTGDHEPRRDRADVAGHGLMGAHYET